MDSPYIILFIFIDLFFLLTMNILTGMRFHKVTKHKFKEETTDGFTGDLFIGMQIIMDQIKNRHPKDKIYSKYLRMLNYGYLFMFVLIVFSFV